MDNATKRPWTLDCLPDHPAQVTIYADLGEDGAKCIASVGNAEAWADALSEWQANARLIVTAVNQHAALLRCAEALRTVKSWAVQRCPCVNELPNPCPLCGASVENLEACKSAENTLPRRVLEAINASLSALEQSNG